MAFSRLCINKLDLQQSWDENTMGRKNNFKKNDTKRSQPNQTVLDSIGSPNVWTPEIEDAWLQELHNIPAIEIYQRFPPMKKPPNVRSRGKGTGWGGNE